VAEKPRLGNAGVKISLAALWLSQPNRWGPRRLNFFDKMGKFRSIARMASSAATHSIRLPVRSLDALMCDANNPLLDSGIHPEAAEAIEMTAAEAPRGAELEIILVVPAADCGGQAGAEEAIHHHFARAAERAKWDLRAKLQLGFKALLVAFLVVAGLVVLVEWMQAFGQGRLYRLFGESLVIIGWVTMWVPAETLLIAPWPLRKRLRLLQKLSHVRVTLEPNRS
jgi:hypothetical protein